MKMKKTGVFVPPLAVGMLLFIALIRVSRSQDIPPDMPQCAADDAYDDEAGHTIRWPSVNRTQPPHNVYDIASSPLCLDGRKFLLARNCTTQSGWQPPQSPQCVYTQQSYDEAEKCPLGYRTISAVDRNGRLESVCVLLTTERAWNNTCLPNGSARTVLDLNTSKKRVLFDYLRDRQVRRLWLPARRRERFGPLVWQMVGRRYGEIVEFDADSGDVELEGDGSVADGCLSLNADNDGFSAAVEDCEREYVHVCVYDENSSLLQLSCPDGFVTTRFDGQQSECYAMQRVLQVDFGPIASTARQPRHQQQQRQTAAVEPPTFNWVESECRGELYSLDTPLKTSMYEQLWRRAQNELESGNDGDDGSSSDGGARCLIGVLPNVLVESREQWTELAPLVNFVNWASPAPPPAPPSLVAPRSVITADRHGRWHWSADFSCIACQRRVQPRRPHIELRFHDERRLYAIVYNREHFWRERDSDTGFKCFTDADSELVRTVRIEGEVLGGRFAIPDLNGIVGGDQSRTVYELRTSGDGPGYYWCNGHAVPGFALIQSQPIVAHKSNHRSGVVFAVLVQTECGPNGCAQLAVGQSKAVKEMARRFREMLQVLRRAARKQQTPVGVLAGSEDMSVESVRMMRVHSIDRLRGRADVLFHVTVEVDDEDDEDGSDEEDHLELTVEMIHIYRTRNLLQRILKPTVANASAEFRYISLNSTEYCLPDSISAASDLNWGCALIGQSAAPLELCLMANGLPVRRHCVGDQTYGGAWSNVTARQPESQHCDDRNLSPVTRSLYEIDRTFNSRPETTAVIHNVTQLIESTDLAHLIPADLYYLGRVMQTVIKFNQMIGIHDGGGAATTSTTSLSTTATPTNNNASTSSSTTIAAAAPTSTTLLRRTESEKIFTIYNRLMLLNENTTRLSAALNATNVLLEALDNVVNRMQSDSLLLRNAVNLTEDKALGTIAMLSDKLLVYVIDPSVANVSGISLMLRPGWQQSSSSFYDFDIRLLRSNQSTDDLLHDEMLELAVFVPSDLLRSLNETRSRSMVVSSTAQQQAPVPPMAPLPPTPTSRPMPPLPPIRVVVTVYYNDLLFQEYRRTTYAKAAGKIISVSIPGYGAILPGLLPILIRTESASDTNHTAANATTNAGNNNNSTCGYWNFRTTTWSNDGCEYGGTGGHNANTSIVMCACSHLTHFAHLIMGTYFHSFAGDEDMLVVMDSHQGALDLITLLGCSLSLAGIVGIAVTAIVFRTWREKASTKVLLHLSAAIALQMVLLCFVNTEVRSMDLFVNQQWHGCVWMGALLHYAVLVAFSWMLITAYLQFIRYVRVIGHQRSGRFFLKSSLFGWGAPLVPVGLVVAIAPQSYIPDLAIVGQGGICYPTGAALYAGVIAPMALIVMANLVIFVLVIYHIVRGPDGKLRTANERDLTMAQLRLTVLLFFLLGLTWIFGFLASTHAGLVFSYLFCLTATLQGFVLFLYFIVLDPVTRRLWCRWLKKYVGCGAKEGLDGVNGKSGVTTSFSCGDLK